MASQEQMPGSMQPIVAWTDIRVPGAAASVPHFGVLSRGWTVLKSFQKVLAEDATSVPETCGGGPRHWLLCSGPCLRMLSSSRRNSFEAVAKMGFMAGAAPTALGTQGTGHAVAIRVIFEVSCSRSFNLRHPLSFRALDMSDEIWASWRQLPQQCRPQMPPPPSYSPLSEP